MCQPHHGGILSSEPAVGSPAESTESMETSPPPATAATVPRDASQSGSDALMDTDGTTGTGNVYDETKFGFLNKCFWLSLVVCASATDV